MTQKTVTRLIMLSIIVFMLQACNSELDYSEDNLITDAQKHASELTEKEYDKYDKIYYLPSSNSKRDQTEKFQSIVNGMKRNDALVVSGGTHYIKKTIVLSTAGVTIIGQPGNVFKLQPGYRVTLVHIAEHANNITIRNINLDGTGGRIYRGAGLPADACMFVLSNSNNFQNSTFRNAGNGGLLLHGSNYNTINGCKFSNNYMVGLSQWYSSNNTISWCQSYDNGAEGVTIDGNSHNITLHHSWISRNNLPHRGVGGIGIDAANNARIYNNTIDRNGSDGIKIQNNLCGGVLNLSIYNNENVSLNQGAALGIRRNGQPVTFGNTIGNHAVGNALGVVHEYTDTRPCQNYGPNGPY